MTGIYLIRNKVNGHCYVGKSIDIEERWKQHIRESKRKGNQAIHNAIAKYGADNFDFTVLEECSAEELNEREIQWIDKLDTFNNGYNCTLGGDGYNQGKNCYSAEYKRDRQKAWREANPDKNRAKIKAWRDSNPEKVSASKKKYREANKEKIRAAKKAYYESHKKKVSDETDSPLF